MHYLDLTVKSPEGNLALDEALLDYCDGGHFDGEILRFWESEVPFVVLGLSGRVSEDVNVTYCNKMGYKILRRPSGGGTVLQGPGSLNYAFILKIERAPAFASINAATQAILTAQKSALKPLAATGDIQIEGISDLTLDGKKFSGNAQRRKRHYFLFHGTLLYNFNLEEIERSLKLPPKRPAYRDSKSHMDFLCNFRAEKDSLKNQIKDFWKASQPFKGLSPSLMTQLIRDKYSQESWNYKFV